MNTEMLRFIRSFLPWPIWLKEDDGTLSRGTIAEINMDENKPWWLDPIPSMLIRWDDGDEDWYFGEHIDEVLNDCVDLEEAIKDRSENGDVT
jgi:hypothetical protein